MPVRINRGGYYGSEHFYGENPLRMERDIALELRIPNNETAIFDTLTITDCGLPFVHYSGSVKIDTLISRRFTADLFNSIGNLQIKRMIIDYGIEGFSGRLAYHSDMLGQFFNKKRKLVENVYIGEITAYARGSRVQGMMLSERNDYRNFVVGAEGINIDIEYPYWFVANTLRDSKIYMPPEKVKIKNVKLSRFASINNMVGSPRSIANGDMIA